MLNISRKYQGSFFDPEVGVGYTILAENKGEVLYREDNGYTTIMPLSLLVKLVDRGLWVRRKS